jgi:hypothetical protein
MKSTRSLIVEKLKKEVSDFKAVKGTVNINAVLRQGFPNPACFVWRISRKRISNPGAILQYESSYGVLIVVKIDNDDGSVDDMAESISDKMASILDDWQPHEKAGLVYDGGEVMTDLERNLLFWKDTYLLKEFGA